MHFSVLFCSSCWLKTPHMMKASYLFSAAPNQIHSDSRNLHLVVQWKRLTGLTYGLGVLLMFLSNIKHWKQPMLTWLEYLFRNKYPMLLHMSFTLARSHQKLTIAYWWSLVSTDPRQSWTDAFQSNNGLTHFFKPFFKTKSMWISVSPLCLIVLKICISLAKYFTSGLVA